MSLTTREHQLFAQILEEELLPAMGCTEPIAIAYVAAVARETLGTRPDRVKVEASGNIIKNVKSVVVPNTGGLKGIQAAAAAGIVAGDSSLKLEVISHTTPAQQREMEDFLATVPVEVALAESEYIFDVVLVAYSGDHWAKVRIVDHHTNIVAIEKDGEMLHATTFDDVSSTDLTDRSFMTTEKILEYAETADLDTVRHLLDRQIDYNMAIAQEGLAGEYGANIGRVLMGTCPQGGDEATLRQRARAMAAAGSDARMNGCGLPVVINSGSGNQGITASVPVIVYAQAMEVGEEKLYRALVLSNLMGIHQKTLIGRLSAYCGAVNAGAAAGCGVAYLKGGGLDVISHTLVNALAVASGVICDGAKASCAGKIALAVDCGLLGYEMYVQNQQFYGGDGIVKKGIENTIASVGRLASQGMRSTDIEILNIMIDK